MSSELDLQIEVERLNLQVERLTLRLVEVEDRLRDLEAAQTSGPLVGGRGNRSSVSSGAPSSEWTALSSASSVVPVESTDREGREALARHIGQFLARGLNGQFRGSSGRDRLRLQNRYYLICKNFSGDILEEPILASSFQEVRQHCKRGSDCGLSLFVGFATLWEARIAAQEAGLPLPSALRNA